ncbi:MAG: hypothetical protein RJB60_435 [Pseudomonadota bacterium]|jgi:hypothetical protein
MNTQITANNADTSTSLAWLQEALQKHILQGDTEVASAVQDQGRLPPLARLNIYHAAYRWRLLEVMQDHFGQTHRYLGDEFFNSEAQAFIEAHPSEQHNLRDYGLAWPDWLAQRYPDDTDMADLARLEWALRQAFDAANRPTMGLAELGTIPAEAWATLGFELAPGTTVLRLSHAVAPLWQSLSREEAPEPVRNEATCLLVWRQGWQPHFRSLQADEAQAVEALLAGHSFSEACAHLAASNNGEARVSQWLQAWAKEGLLARVNLGD